MTGGVDNSTTVALVALLGATKRKWSDVRADLEETFPEELLLRELHPDLISDHVGEAIAAAKLQIDLWRQQGISVSSPYSADYPPQLRSVHDYPPLLFTRGEFSTRDYESVAVVGTRNPSVGALRFIDDVVPLIAGDGHPVVSGLALGVDAAAMRASLAIHNRTVGIIGSGINTAYPAANRELQEQVAREHLLVSQFWPDAPPTQHTFPMRNHVMSAFACLTLIVEAGENSGTRIQARAATQHARPLILTSAVYSQTQWAKDLVARRLDVTIVSSAEQAIAAIREIRGRESQPPVWTAHALSLAGSL
jgi:DNA processing protein